MARAEVRGRRQSMTDGDSQPDHQEGGDELLKVEGVGFTYSAGSPVLGRIDLTVKHGEIVAVVGPSGSGKSTLLAIVTGALSASTGHITWTQDALVHDQAGRRPVTMLFQTDTLLPWRTAIGNVEYALRLAGAPRKARRPEAESLLSSVRLPQQFWNHRPAQLSGGMRRRVGLAVAVAPRPRLLLMDEPLHSLDEPSRVVIHEEILSVARSHNMAILLATHDLAEAVTLADRVYVLSRPPTSCIATFVLPFGRSRDVFSLREHPDYHDFYSKIWTTLRAEIQADRAARDISEQGGRST